MGRLTGKISFRSIKAKLMIYVGIPVVILVVLLLAKSYQESAAQLIDERSIALEQRYDQVLELINSQSLTSYYLATWVASMPDVKQYLAERKRNDLKQLMLPTYRSVRKELNLKQFQFHIPPATSFLRLHKPNKYGDDLSDFRFTVVQANREKKPKMGLERGVAGIGIRAVVPVSFQGKHVGTVEFGSRLNNKLILPLKENYHFNISVVIPDGDKFKFQARTHNMEISPKSYPTLRRVIDTGKTEIRRVNKDNKALLTFFGPLRDFSGKIIGVITVPDDVTAQIARIKKNLYLYIGAGLLIILIILGVVYFTMDRLINRPLKEMIRVFNKAEKGDLTDHLEIKREDEMGELGNSFNAFLEKTREVLKEIGNSSDTLDYSSTELTSISKQMATSAEETSGRSNTVATAAEEMSANMNSVAAAVEEASTNVGMVANSTEEMTSVINEIAQKSEQAKEVTGEAVSEANSASDKVDELGRAANEIGEVTETITEIAEQVNLLALNATIEAARAGEAGKGFAVVANEIKELAKQTAEATGEIKEKIEGIQTSTEGTVGQIKQISKVVNDLNEIVSTIATAVEEQSVTTREISNNVVQAAQGIQEVTENVAQSSTVSREIARDIAEVNQAATEMSNSSSQVNMSAEELSKLAEQLKKLVERFKV